MLGMSTLTNSVAAEKARATGVRFIGDTLQIALSDGREINLPYKKVGWLKWLAKATVEQRSHWTIEPGGFAVYWSDLDDGVEICHLLATQEIA